MYFILKSFPNLISLIVTLYINVPLLKQLRYLLEKSMILSPGNTFRRLHPKTETLRQDFRFLKSCQDLFAE